MGAVRHKSVKLDTFYTLELICHDANLTVTQPVTVIAKCPNELTVSHVNGWTRNLVTESGDTRDYRDPSGSPSVTFKLHAAEGVQEVA